MVPHQLQYSSGSQNARDHQPKFENTDTRNVHHNDGNLNQSHVKPNGESTEVDPRSHQLPQVVLAPQQFSSIPRVPQQPFPRPPPNPFSGQISNSFMNGQFHSPNNPGTFGPPPGIPQANSARMNQQQHLVMPHSGDTSSMHFDHQNTFHANHPPSHGKHYQYMPQFGPPNGPQLPGKMPFQPRMESPHPGYQQGELKRHGQQLDHVNQAPPTMNGSHEQLRSMATTVAPQIWNKYPHPENNVTRSLPPNVPQRFCVYIRFESNDREILLEREFLQHQVRVAENGQCVVEVRLVPGHHVVSDDCGKLEVQCTSLVDRNVAANFSTRYDLSVPVTEKTARMSLYSQQCHSSLVLHFSRNSVQDPWSLTLFGMQLGEVKSLGAGQLHEPIRHVSLPPAGAHHPVPNGQHSGTANGPPVPVKEGPQVARVNGQPNDDVPPYVPYGMPYPMTMYQQSMMGYYNVLAREQTVFEPEHVNRTEDPGNAHYAPVDDIASDAEPAVYVQPRLVHSGKGQSGDKALVVEVNYGTDLHQLCTAIQHTGESLLEVFLGKVRLVYGQSVQSLIERTFAREHAQSEELMWKLLRELSPYFVQLLVDPYGQYTITSLFDHANPEQKLYFLLQIQACIGPIAANGNGTFSLQRMIQSLDNQEHADIVARQLGKDAEFLAEHPHAVFVLCKAFKVGGHLTKSLARELASNSKFISYVPHLSVSRVGHKLILLLSQINGTPEMLALHEAMAGVLGTKLYFMSNATHVVGSAVLEQLLRSNRNGHLDGQVVSKLVEHMLEDIDEMTTLIRNTHGTKVLRLVCLDPMVGPEVLTSLFLFDKTRSGTVEIIGDSISSSDEVLELLLRDSRGREFLDMVVSQLSDSELKNQVASKVVDVLERFRQASIAWPFADEESTRLEAQMRCSVTQSTRGSDARESTGSVKLDQNVNVQQQESPRISKIVQLDPKPCKKESRQYRTERAESTSTTDSLKNAKSTKSNTTEGRAVEERTQLRRIEGKKARHPRKLMKEVNEKRDDKLKSAPPNANATQTRNESIEKKSKDNVQRKSKSEHAQHREKKSSRKNEQRKGMKRETATSAKRVSNSENDVSSMNAVTGQ